MSSAYDTLAALREDADVLLQQAETSRARLTSARAADSTGQVTAQLDRDGAVHAVQVGFTWDQALSPEQLPAAVVEAITNARMIQLEQWGDAYRSTESEPRRARPHDDSVVARLREQVEARGGTPDAAGRMVEEMLGEVVVGLEEANRLLEEHLTRHYVGRSRPGHVTATAGTNGDLLSVEYADGWLPGAHPANIGRETTQAITAAARVAREQGLAASLRAGKLATVARVFLAQSSSPETDGTNRDGGRQS